MVFLLHWRLQPSVPLDASCRQLGCNFVRPSWRRPCSMLGSRSSRQCMYLYTLTRFWIWIWTVCEGVTAGLDIISYLPCRRKINLPGTVFWLPELFTMRSKTPKQTSSKIKHLSTILCLFWKFIQSTVVICCCCFNAQNYCFYLAFTYCPLLDHTNCLEC